MEPPDIPDMDVALRVWQSQWEDSPKKRSRKSSSKPYTEPAASLRRLLRKILKEYEAPMPGERERVICASVCARLFHKVNKLDAGHPWAELLGHPECKVSNVELQGDCLLTLYALAAEAASIVDAVKTAYAAYFSSELSRYVRETEEFEKRWNLKKNEEGDYLVDEEVIETMVRWDEDLLDLRNDLETMFDDEDGMDGDEDEADEDESDGDESDEDTSDEEDTHEDEASEDGEEEED